MLQILRKTHKSSAISVVRLMPDYRYLMTTLALTLSGCMGVYEGGFECPPGKGVGCKSISEVNEMIDQGVLPPEQHSGLTVLQRTEKKELERVAGKEPTCGEDHAGSCSLNSEIWYSPWFSRGQKENQKTKVWDGKNSI